MANRENNLLIKWGVFILLCLATLLFGIHKLVQNVIGPEASNNPSATSAQQNGSPAVSISGVQMQEGVTKEQNISSPNSLTSKQAINTNVPNKQNPTSQQADNTSQSSSSTPDLVGSSGSINQGNTVTSALANPIPTQEQIIASINLQDQQRQVLDQALSDRTKQIEKVHQAILDSGVQYSYGQVKPFVDPIVKPPEDIVQKLKSHTLVGH